MFHIKKVIVKTLLICASLAMPHVLMAMDENPHLVNMDLYVNKLKNFYEIHGKSWSYTYSSYEEEPDELKKIAKRLDL